MTLTSIPLSSGDTLDTITSATNLKYDAASTNTELADAGAPTFTTGASFSLSCASNSSTFGAAAINAAIIGSTTANSASTRSALIATSGSNITAGVNNAIIAGTNNSILTTATNGAIIASMGCTVNVGNAAVIAASNNCSQTAVSTRSVILGSSTIINSGGGTLDSTGIYNCLGDGTSSTGIAGVNTQSAVIASNMPIINSSGSRNAIIATDTATITGSTLGAVIVGGHNQSLTGNYSAILGGESNTISAANATAMGKNMTVSAAGALGFCDHTLAGSTLSTVDSVGLYSTNGTVIANTGSVQPNSKSVLTLNSTTRGFLKPRLTTTQKNAISSPPAGLEVYDSTLNVPNYFDGTVWIDPDNTDNFSFVTQLIGRFGPGGPNMTVTGTSLGPNNEWVTLSFPGAFGAATVTDRINFFIPMAYAPAEYTSKFIPIQYDGSTVAFGMIEIVTNGGATISALLVPPVGNAIVASTAFTQVAGNGFYPFTMTYPT